MYDGNDNSLALSKNNFAEYIYNKEDNFANVSVDGFDEIFATIEDIINLNT